MSAFQKQLHLEVSDKSHVNSKSRELATEALAVDKAADLVKQPRFCR